MSSLSNDLDLLESLSKKISDLIFEGDFSLIPEMDSQRQKIIKKIIDNNLIEFNFSPRVCKLIEDNNKLINFTEAKIAQSSKKRNIFNKRLKAYSYNR